jgi:putative methionine-R-sulfoxide reductase with GAF domain
VSLSRLASNVILPIVVTITAAIGTINHGVAAVYWYIGTVVGLLINGLIGYNKDHSSSSGRQAAIKSAAELATERNNMWRPVVAALGNVTYAAIPEEARRELWALIDRTVGLVQTELASSSKSQTRAAFYSIEQDKLVRKIWHGWNGCRAPRTEFVQGRTVHDDEVIKCANSEDAQFVDDLEHNPPAHFIDFKGRSYKSFISVPVRAGDRSYGLLTADSDRAYALTGNDRGFLILIAGALGAGLAHVAAVSGDENRPNGDPGA